MIKPSLMHMLNAGPYNNTESKDKLHSVCLCINTCAWRVPEAVSVAVWSVRMWAALSPECPGLGRRPARSSYIVYTKECMYKIEKSGKQKHKEKWLYLHTILYYLTNWLTSTAAKGDVHLYHKRSPNSTHTIITYHTATP